MKIEFLEFFDIPSTTAQQRRHGANGRNWRTPGLKAAQAAWQALLEKHKPVTPMTGPVAVDISLIYHRKLSGREPIEPRIERPDCDNIVKVILDAMVRAGYFEDDRQVYCIGVQKFNQRVHADAVHIQVKEDENKR